MAKSTFQETQFVMLTGISNIPHLKFNRSSEEDVLPTPDNDIHSNTQTIDLDSFLCLFFWFTTLLILSNLFLNDQSSHPIKQ
jgi:hypothetical protein